MNTFQNSEFFCYPVRAETTNDDGTPSSITECPLYTLKVAEGLCELLNGITPAEALHNPKLHILFD